MNAVYFSLTVAGYKAIKTSMVTYSDVAESFLVASKTIKDCILEQFKIHNKIEGSHRDFSNNSCPRMCTDFLVINIPYQSGIVITTDASTLTQYIHTKSIIYISIHSWCYTFCDLDSL